MSLTGRLHIFHYNIELLCCSGWVQEIEGPELQSCLDHIGVKLTAADDDIERGIQLAGFRQKIQPFDRFFVEVDPDQLGADLHCPFNRSGAFLHGNSGNIFQTRFVFDKTFQRCLLGFVAITNQ